MKILHINEHKIEIESNFQSLSFSAILDFLDLASESVVFKLSNFGLINERELRNKLLEKKDNSLLSIHSIVGGG